MERSSSARKTLCCYVQDPLVTVVITDVLDFKIRLLNKNKTKNLFKIYILIDCGFEGRGKKVSGCG